MKKSEIVVGGHYLAKVSGTITTVRVDAIRETRGYGSRRDGTAYDVTNLRTGRKTVFSSAAKFRGPAPAPKPKTNGGLHVGPLGGLTHEPPAEPGPFGQPDPADVAFQRSAEATQQAAENSEPHEEEEGEQSADPTSAGDAADTVLSGGTPTPTHSSARSAGSASPAGAAATPADTTSVPVTNLASRIAATREGRQPGTPVAGMVPNAEQESILEIAVTLQYGNVLVVVAGAGTGKTATLKMLEQTLRGRIQYTAFNKSLVEDSRPKFKKAAVNSTHSLAWRAVGKDYGHRLNSDKMRSSQIAQILGIQEISVPIGGVDEDGNPKMKRLKADFLAGQVLVAVERFCQSADREIVDQHFGWINGIDNDGRANNNRVREYLLPFARKAWDDLQSKDGILPFKHDVYVKVWQLGTGEDRPIIPADYIMLDEYQDTAPVFVDILKQQTHATLVMVGDDNQRIYEWRGAINAGDEFPDAPRRLLAQSYRFGQAVADVANTILATLEEPTDLVMRGNPTLPSRVAAVEEPKCYLYRTNAGAIGRFMSLKVEGKKPHLIGKTDDIIAWCKAALDLQARRGTRHPELACFDTWQEVQEYSKQDEGADLRLMVKLIDTFGADKIRDALEGMPKEEDSDVVLCTAHKSKGREWDTVKLGGDFPLVNKMTDPDRRLLYVAATRAKMTLDISECPPFCGGYDKQGGEDGSGGAEWVPGLEIAYTRPMPTEEELAAFLAGGTAPVAPTALVPASAVVPPARPERPATAATGGFTWAKDGDRWCVRGPANTEVGARVTVTRRDGSTSIVTIRSVVRRYPDAWVYEV